MFNNVEMNKSLEKNITAQLTHAPKAKADQHSAILSYMSKPNECLHRHQRQNTCKHKSYCKQFTFCFEVVQKIYFGVSSSANNFFSNFSPPPPPLEK